MDEAKNQTNKADCFKGIMKAIILFLFFFLLVTQAPANAQITLAIGDFENNSGLFYLDTWKKSIPDYLKSALSKSTQLIMVERNRLEEVLAEQALSMTGLVDSTTAQKVGELLGAAFVISGTISQSGDWVRIDATIIKTETGQLRSEKVQAKGDGYLSEMISLLAQNIDHVLTGEQPYRNKIVIEKYPTSYFLIGTACLAAGSFFANQAYHKKLDAYHQTTELDKFDETYDAANRLKGVRTIMVSLTAAALVGTLYCWINNLSPDEIVAEDLTFIPSLQVDMNRGYHAAVTVYF